MKVIVRVSMSLVALAAAALSFQSLWRLGQLASYGNLAWAYPLVVDLGAASSCAAWLQTRRRQPLIMTWDLLATSVILNGTEHYLDAERIAPSWLLDPRRPIGLRRRVRGTHRKIENDVYPSGVWDERNRA